MTMWVFGDSYLRYYRYYPESWLKIISTELNIEVRSFAKAFSTVNYCYYKFNQIRDQIKENDVIILGTSLDPSSLLPAGHTHRQWDSLNNEEQLALEYRRTFLKQVDDLREVYLINFLYNIQNFSKKYNIHTIILFNLYDFNSFTQQYKLNHFPNLHIPTGVLHGVSENEWTLETFSNKGTDWISVNDLRANHLIKTNHAILANKIIDNVKNKTPLDLTTEFKKHFLDEELINNSEFIKNELFEDFIKNIKLNR